MYSRARDTRLRTGGVRWSYQYVTSNKLHVLDTDSMGEMCMLETTAEFLDNLACRRMKEGMHNALSY